MMALLHFGLLFVIVGVQLVAISVMLAAKREHSELLRVTRQFADRATQVAGNHEHRIKKLEQPAPIGGSPVRRIYPLKHDGERS